MYITHCIYTHVHVLICSLFRKWNNPFVQVHKAAVDPLLPPRNAPSLTCQAGSQRCDDGPTMTSWFCQTTACLDTGQGEKCNPMRTRTVHYLLASGQESARATSFSKQMKIVADTSPRGSGWWMQQTISIYFHLLVSVWRPWGLAKCRNHQPAPSWPLWRRSWSVSRCFPGRKIRELGLVPKFSANLFWKHTWKQSQCVIVYIVGFLNICWKQL